MQSDDPPFLPVGTEVSAKFKGAFCEAKIKRILRSLKCKVLVKDPPLGIVLVEDDSIKNSTVLELGGVVEFTNERGTFRGTLTYVKDYSTYHVVFNDGDEKTLKRSQICRKSPKHFAVNLDALPLYNPEQFSSPVLKGRDAKDKKRKVAANSYQSKRRKQEGDEEDEEGEDDNESAEGSTTSARETNSLINKSLIFSSVRQTRSNVTPTASTPEDRRRGRKKMETSSSASESPVVKKRKTAPRRPKVVIGDVYRVHDNDRKEGKWFPAVLVSQTAYDMVMKGKLLLGYNEVPVRSFQNNRYYAVDRRWLKPFVFKDRNKIPANMKAGVEKAYAFIEKNILPPTWEQLEIFSPAQLKKTKMDLRSEPPETLLTEGGTPDVRSEEEIFDDEDVEEEEEEEDDEVEEEEEEEDDDDDDDDDDEESDEEDEEARKKAEEEEQKNEEAKKLSQREEMKSFFVAQLYKFQEERGTPMNTSPMIGERDLDLHRFHEIVNEYGGFKRITANDQWGKVLAGMELEDVPGATAESVKAAYEKFLLHFDAFHKRLGWAIGNFTSSSSTSRSRDRRQTQPSSEVSTPKASDKGTKKSETAKSKATKKSKSKLSKRKKKKSKVTKKTKKPRWKVRKSKRTIVNIDYNIPGYFHCNPFIKMYVGQPVLVQYEGDWYDAQTIRISQPSVESLVKKFYDLQHQTDGMRKIIKLLEGTRRTNQIFVHYTDWDSSFDEWIYLDDIQIKASDLYAGCHVLKKVCEDLDVDMRVWRRILKFYGIYKLFNYLQSKESNPKFALDEDEPIRLIWLPDNIDKYTKKYAHAGGHTKYPYRKRRTFRLVRWRRKFVSSQMDKWKTYKFMKFKNNSSRVKKPPRGRTKRSKKPRKSAGLDEGNKDSSSAQGSDIVPRVISREREMELKARIIARAISILEPVYDLKFCRMDEETIIHVPLPPKPPSQTRCPVKPLRERMKIASDDVYHFQEETPRICAIINKLLSTNWDCDYKELDAVIKSIPYLDENVNIRPMDREQAIQAAKEEQELVAAAAAAASSSTASSVPPFTSVFTTPAPSPRAAFVASLRASGLSVSRVPAVNPPRAPVSSTPRTPNVTTVRAPPASVPRAPTATTPRTPAATTPRTPAVTTPRTPAATTPRTPAATTPRTPAATTPRAPAATTPRVPAATTPRAPAATTPRAPAATTSRAPAASNPGTSSVTTTRVPAEPSEPAKANQNKPGKLTQSIVAKGLIPVRACDAVSVKNITSKKTLSELFFARVVQTTPPDDEEFNFSPEMEYLRKLRFMRTCRTSSCNIRRRVQTLLLKSQRIKMELLLKSEKCRRERLDICILKIIGFKRFKALRMVKKRRPPKPVVTSVPVSLPLYHDLIKPIPSMYISSASPYFSKDSGLPCSFPVNLPTSSSLIINNQFGTSSTGFQPVVSTPTAFNQVQTGGIDFSQLTNPSAAFNAALGFGQVVNPVVGFNPAVNAGLGFHPVTNTGVGFNPVVTPNYNLQTQPQQQPLSPSPSMLLSQSQAKSQTQPKVQSMVQPKQQQTAKTQSKPVSQSHLHQHQQGLHQAQSQLQPQLLPQGKLQSPLQPSLKQQAEVKVQQQSMVQPQLLPQVQPQYQRVAQSQPQLQHQLQTQLQNQLQSQQQLQPQMLPQAQSMLQQQIQPQSPSQSQPLSQFNGQSTTPSQGQADESPTVLTINGRPLITTKAAVKAIPATSSSQGSSSQPVVTPSVSMSPAYLSAAALAKIMPAPTDVPSSLSSFTAVNPIVLDETSPRVTVPVSPTPATVSAKMTPTIVSKASASVDNSIKPPAEAETVSTPKPKEPKTARTPSSAQLSSKGDSETPRKTSPSALKRKASSQELSAPAPKQSKSKEKAAAVVTEIDETKTCLFSLSASKQKTVVLEKMKKDESTTDYGLLGFFVDLQELNEVNDFSDEKIDELFARLEALKDMYDCEKKNLLVSEKEYKERVEVLLRESLSLPM